MINYFRIKSFLFGMLYILSVTIPIMASEDNIFMPPDELIIDFSKHIFMTEYDEAIIIADSVRKLVDLPSADAWAGLLTASVILTRVVDLADSSLLPVYHQNYELASEAFEKKLESDIPVQQRVAVLFALSTLNTLQSTYRFEMGKSLLGVSSVMRGVKRARKAYQLDSTFVDPVFIFSLYDYYVSKALLLLTVTPLKKDLRPEAINNIFNVISSGTHSRYPAMVYLAWIYIEEKRYNDAAAFCDSLLEEHGETRTILEPSAKAHFLLENWTEADDRYSRFLLTLRQAPKRNLVRETGTLHRLAEIAINMNNWERVILLAEDAFSLPLSEAEMDIRKKELKNLKKMYSQAKDKMEVYNHDDY